MSKAAAVPKKKSTWVKEIHRLHRTKDPLAYAMPKPGEALSPKGGAPAPAAAAADKKKK